MSSREQTSRVADPRAHQRSAVWLALAVCTSLAPTAASAQDASGTKVTVASDVGLEGLGYFRDGRYAEALAAFTAAERVQHSPVFVLFIARCHDKLGDPMAARKLLGEVANEVLVADAPDTWRKAKAEAAEDLALLDAAMPRLVVSVVSGSRLDALRLDDADLAPGETILVAPGKHRITARVDGVEVTREVDLARGSGTSTVELTPVTTRESSYLPAGLCLGIGGGVLAVGVVTGVVALGLGEDIQERCFGNRCDPDDESRAGTATALGVVSTASFVAGGALAVAGIVLVITPPTSEVRVEVGAGSVRLGARF